MKHKLKNTQKILIKILVSVLILTFIFLNIDRGAVVSNFMLLDTTLVPLILILFFLNYFISSIRWKLLLIHGNSDHISIWDLTSLYFVGSFFNNFMPTSIGGDVYKIVTLGNKIKSKTDALSATFMERFTGMVALVFISYYGLIKTLPFWIGQLPLQISQSPLFLSIFKFLLFFGFWIAAVVGFSSLKFLSKKFEVVRNVYKSLSVYKNERKVVGSAFLTSFIVQFLAIFTQFYVFKALGVTLDVSYALFVFPVVTLASFFIPSLNGIGVQDALYIQLFSVVGVAPELALSASIIYHLFRLFVSLFGGVFYVFKKN